MDFRFTNASFYAIMMIMEKYKRIYKDLYYKIKSGELPSGSKLPTEAELAKAYSVSKITVKTALNLLKSEGLVIRKKRLGTVVLNGIVNPSADKLIAVVFSGFDHLDIRIVNGLKQIALTKNVKLTFFDSAFKLDKEREILGYLLSENIAGLILMPVSQGGNIEAVSMFAVQKIPVVFMDFPSFPAFAPTVTSDNYGGAYEMTSYLVEAGHTRIGFFPYSERFYPTERERFEGYCRALVDHGIPISDDYLFTSSARDTYSIIASVTNAEPDSAAGFYKKYDALASKPSAVVCVNDLCAHAVIEEGKRRGVAVPENLSVTGFDNLAVSVKDDITTVAQDFAEISKTALLTLLRKIDGSVNEPTKIKIRTVLVRRDSVKKLQPTENG